MNREQVDCGLTWLREEYFEPTEYVNFMMNCQRHKRVKGHDKLFRPILSDVSGNCARNSGATYGSMLVSSGFYWGDAPEGETYWHNTSIDIMKICRKKILLQIK